jgi:uroporphyrinogen-III synthase
VKSRGYAKNSHGFPNSDKLIFRKPLNKKTIAITRKPEDAKEFLNLVASAGGRAIALPTIDFVPNHRAIKNAIRRILVDNFDICIFMSPKGVSMLCSYATQAEGMEELKSILNTKAVIAQGPATKNVLQNYGISVEQIPDKFSSEGMVSLFRRLELGSGKKVIIPRSGKSNDYLGKELLSMGLGVTELFLYSTKTAVPGQIWNEFVNLINQGEVDALIFTSGSSVCSFFEILNKFTFSLHHLPLTSTVIISIGPLTTKKLKERSIYCIEASEHTIRGTFELAKSVLESKTLPRRD